MQHFYVISHKVDGRSHVATVHYVSMCDNGKPIKNHVSFKVSGQGLLFDVSRAMKITGVLMEGYRNVLDVPVQNLSYDHIVIKEEATIWIIL